MPIEYEFIDDDSEGDNEEGDVDIWEFSLDDDGIDDLIEALKELKETKGHFHFELDEENEIIIHHEDDLDEEEE